jgi:hypothetical protein
LWSAVLAAGDGATHAPAGVGRVKVVRGDRLYFRVQSVFEGSGDEVTWDPEIRYLDVPPAPDANRHDAHHYRASEDFVLAGRAGSARMPNTGHVRVKGVFTKPDTTSDDVAISVRRNDTEILRTTMPWDSTGEVALDVDFDVVGDDTTTHDKDEADHVSVRLAVDSPIDAPSVGWRADAPPELTYESIQGASARAASGEALISILLPSDMDLYPADGLDAPQGSWKAPDDGRLTVQTQLDGDWSFHRAGEKDPVTDGELVFTVKRDGRRVGKQTIAVSGGHATNVRFGGMPLAKGDLVFFDVAMRDVAAHGRVAARIGFATASDSNAMDVPCALHTDVDPGDATLGNGLFGEPYRGWIQRQPGAGQPGAAAGVCPAPPGPDAADPRVRPRAERRDLRDREGEARPRDGRYRAVARVRDEPGLRAAPRRHAAGVLARSGGGVVGAGERRLVHARRRGADRCSLPVRRRRHSRRGPPRGAEDLQRPGCGRRGGLLRHPLRHGRALGQRPRLP